MLTSPVKPLIRCLILGGLDWFGNLNLGFLWRVEGNPLLNHQTTNPNHQLGEGRNKVPPSAGQKTKQKRRLQTGRDVGHGLLHAKQTGKGAKSHEGGGLTGGVPHRCLRIHGSQPPSPRWSLQQIGHLRAAYLMTMSKQAESVAAGCESGTSASRLHSEPCSFVSQIKN